MLLGIVIIVSGCVGQNQSNAPLTGCIRDYQCSESECNISYRLLSECIDVNNCNTTTNNISAKEFCDYDNKISDGAVYNDSVHGFSILHPANWTANWTIPKSDGWFFIFTSPREEIYDNVTYISLALSRHSIYDFANSTIVNSLITDALASTSNVIIFEDEYLLINNNLAYSLRYSDTTEYGNRMNQVYIFESSKTHVYVLLFYGEPDIFETDMPIFNDVVNSFNYTASD